MTKLYHGSDHIVSKPTHGVGNPHNDYGLGFYCTESLDLAKEWAVEEQRNGYANRYQLDCNGLQILDLNSSEYTVLHWLAILIQNRTFESGSNLVVEAKQYLTQNFNVDIDSYDVIVGYRADDSYFSFAQDFLNNTISYRQLANAMRFGELGQQFVLKSREAFERIEYLGYEDALHTEWYAQKMMRDRKARSAYLQGERYRRQAGDLFVLQIIDERIGANDPRIR